MISPPDPPRRAASTGSGTPATDRPAPASPRFFVFCDCEDVAAAGPWPSTLAQTVGDIHLELGHHPSVVPDWHLAERLARDAWRAMRGAR